MTDRLHSEAGHSQKLLDLYNQTKLCKVNFSLCSEGCASEGFISEASRCSSLNVLRAFSSLHHVTMLIAALHPREH